MRRALAIWMAIVMVFAPCAVAQAASAELTTQTGQVHTVHAEPDTTTFHHHRDTDDQSLGHCLAGSHDGDHEVCAGNCGKQNRAAAQEQPQPGNQAKPVFAVVLLTAFVIFGPTEIQSARLRFASDLSIGNTDSKSVLRRTARLRI